METQTDLLRYGIPGFVLAGLGFIVKLVVGYMQSFTLYYADKLDEERQRADIWEQRARKAEEQVAEMRHKLIIYRIDPPPNDNEGSDDIMTQQDKEH